MVQKVNEIQLDTKEDTHAYGGNRRSQLELLLFV